MIEADVMVPSRGISPRSLKKMARSCSLAIVSATEGWEGMRFSHRSTPS